jgi:hypothetical protein
MKEWHILNKEYERLYGYQNRDVINAQQRQRYTLDFRRYLIQEKIKPKKKKVAPVVYSTKWKGQN